VSELNDSFKEAFEGESSDAIRRIVDEITYKPKQPGEFTVYDVAEQTGIGTRTVYNKLKTLETKGKLTSRMPGRERYYKWVD